MAPDSGITHLLLAWREGDRGAFDQLVPVVYAELRRLAHRYMQGERAGHLLQTTALVQWLQREMGPAPKPPAGA